jgi:hypothetical protein
MAAPPPSRLLRHALLLLAPLLAAGAGAALFGAPEPLDAFAPEARAGSAPDASFDAAPWARFLDRYLVTDHPSGVHRVRYGAVSADDLADLDAWLEATQARGPDGLTRDAQFAWWVNLYNALTVRLILDDPAVESIRDLGLLGTGPWGREVAEVDGAALSLDDIEHRILRPLFGDRRVHFAVNCASVGCPDLAAEPWRAAELDARLDAAVRSYLAHPRGLRFEDGRLHLSSIFDWYRDDFPEGREAFLAWLASYAPQPQGERLRSYGGRIVHGYDWSLNEP